MASKKKVVKPKPPGRNDGDSAVYAISATKEFWELIKVKMAETGLTRSKLMVDTCIEIWGLPESVKSRRVGRPAFKLKRG